MWRGGLSAPQSLYIHADRPLLSENGTSTLLHELLHVSLGFAAENGYDWILEGLAEYYSLEILRRSGTISAARFERALADLADWSGEAKALCGPASTGPTTALAVTLLANLHREMQERSDRAVGLDDVIERLWGVDGKVDLDALRSAAEQAAGARLDALHIDKLPGCRSIGAGRHSD
jgi:predicted metalloprotease with PDZ domain